MIPNLSLGTAQFGLDYGVTNKKGKLTKDAIKKILLYAKKADVQFLDTAQFYGDSEKVIGKSLPIDHKFKICTKLTPLENVNIDLNLIETLESNLKRSFDYLGQSCIDTFLIHRPSDLKGLYGEKIINWLTNLRNKKLVKNIGLSIYERKDLNFVPIDEFQVIQLPLSVYDQRLIDDGTVDFLFNKKISIHCRSIFLQGLILENPKNLPRFLSNKFYEFHLKNHKRFKDLDTTPLEVAINFIKQQKKIDNFIVGISSLKEFIEIHKIWITIGSKIKNLDYSQLAWKNNLDLDPRSWS